jgi:hypothetical protein
MYNTWPALLHYGQRSNRWCVGSAPVLQGSRASARSLATPAWGAECSAGQGPVFAALRCIRAMRPTAAAAYMAWPTDGTGTYRSVQHAAAQQQHVGRQSNRCISAWVHGCMGAWMHGCRRVVASLCILRRVRSIIGISGPKHATRPRGPDKVGRAEARAQGRAHERAEAPFQHW